MAPLDKPAVAPEPAPPESPRWRISPDEIPPDLRDNWFVRGAMATTDEQQALLDKLAERDRHDAG
jgi:hypothetical protein